MDESMDGWMDGWMNECSFEWKWVNCEDKGE